MKMHLFNANTNIIQVSICLLVLPFKTRVGYRLPGPIISPDKLKILMSKVLNLLGYSTRYLMECWLDRSRGPWSCHQAKLRILNNFFKSNFACKVQPHEKGRGIMQQPPGTCYCIRELTSATHLHTSSKRKDDTDFYLPVLKSAMNSATIV